MLRALARVASCFAEQMPITITPMLLPRDVNETHDAETETLMPRPEIALARGDPFRIS